MENHGIKENILFQMDMCWQLYLYHTENLEDKEAYWAYSQTSLQVHKNEDGWYTDWPESESYEMGPSSIAWTMWHMIYWWTTALNFNFGEGTLKKEEIPWPGSVENAKAKIKLLHNQWHIKINELSDEDFYQTAKWPLEGRNYVDLALWLNGELMKNAAEIGYGRFLYAVGTA